MSQGTISVIKMVQDRIAEQEKVLERARQRGTEEEIAREENNLASMKRQLAMLEREAQMGH